METSHPPIPIDQQSLVALYFLSPRVELSNAIFEYLEIFHNRKRRHSSLGMLTPVEYELQNASPTAA